MSSGRRTRRTVTWHGARPGAGEYLRLTAGGVPWRIADVATLSDGRIALDLRRVSGDLPLGSIRHSHTRIAMVDPVGPAAVRQIARGGATAVMAGSWHDPARPVDVRGWRAFCVLRRARAAGSTQITVRHVAAADLLRLRVDQARLGFTPEREIGDGVRTAPGPVGGPSESARAAAGAAADLRRMISQMPEADRRYLFAILLRNISVSRWCRMHDPALDARGEMRRLIRLLDDIVRMTSAELVCT